MKKEIHFQDGKKKGGRRIKKQNSLLSSTVSGIDLKSTGRHLRNIFNFYGYSVKDIQRLLRLSCPQPVYRWMKGQALPSAYHLYVLSQTFHIHMENLLIVQNLQIYRNKWWICMLAESWILEDTAPIQILFWENRISAYWKRSIVIRKASEGH